MILRGYVSSKALHSSRYPAFEIQPIDMEHGSLRSNNNTLCEGMVPQHKKNNSEFVMDGP